MLAAAFWASSARPRCCSSLNELVADVDEHPGDQHGLRDGALAVAGRLERLVGVGREAVEVQAVVPVGPADQRQPVWPEVLEHVAEGAAQVLQEAGPVVLVVVEGDLLLQGCVVARFFDVPADPQDEPEGVVVEAFADVGVPFFRERFGTGGRRSRWGSCVAAMSRIRCRARSGTMWTTPSRSWLQSRKPMPRPMPDS